MSDTTHKFSNILFGGRAGKSEGTLRVTPAGLVWRKDLSKSPGTGKTVEVQRKDISGLIWTKLSSGCQLAVKVKDAPVVTFQGFRDQDLEVLREVGNELNQDVTEEALAVSGRNWGAAVIDGATLAFRVGDRTAFRVPLPDCGQVQQGKDEVILEFPVDDTMAGRADALVDMNFYVPKDSRAYAGPDEETPASKVFYDRVLERADVDRAVGDAVVTFENCAVLAPRGRFEIEMYLSFMKLVGQAQDYRIQYSHIMRLFVLPKTNSPHTLVVVSMDPPIRKGQTLYPHVLCQFPTDEELSVDLDIAEDALKSKNDKCGGRLQTSFTGPAYDVFAKCLRGLSASKLTKPGSFRTADGTGHAVRCSYKADDGYLYPLERAFFYVHKPPTLLAHDEIESAEFMRQGGGVLAASAKTFDLAIRTKSEQEYLFRGIQKSEWTNLFNFISAKGLRIENLREAELGPGGGGPALDLGEDIDTGMAHMQAQGELDEEEEEDEDFEAVSEPSDDGEEEDEEEGAAVGGGEGASPEPKKQKKRPAETPDGAPKLAKKAKAEKAPEAADGKPAKKPRKKKDPNAPKQGLSAFMFYSKAMREEVKAQNPTASFGELGKLLGERWRALPAEEKAPYDQQAAQDKQRWASQMAAYKGAQADAAGGDVNGDAGGSAQSE